MKNAFTKGVKYNAAQSIANSALAKGHFPIHYVGLVFIESITEDGVTEHRFNYEGEDRYFDDAFTNDGTSFCNSITIVEQNI